MTYGNNVTITSCITVLLFQEIKENFFLREALMNLLEISKCLMRLKSLLLISVIY